MSSNSFLFLQLVDKRRLSLTFTPLHLADDFCASSVETEYWGNNKNTQIAFKWLHYKTVEKSQVFDTTLPSTVKFM